MAIGVLRLHLLELEKVSYYQKWEKQSYQGSRIMSKLYGPLYTVFENEDAS